MPKMFILSGLPGSGKSTKAKLLAATHRAIIVSTDEIRAELYGSAEIQGDPDVVFATARNQVRIALDRGWSVIIDSTNLRQEFRHQWVKIARARNVPYEIVKISTPLVVCLWRNALRERRVPLRVILKMWWNQD